MVALCVQSCSVQRQASERLRVESSELREARDSLREEISQNLNENLSEHEVVTETVIYTIDCVEPAHARQTESELSSVLAQSPPSLKIERITDRTRTLESGSKFQDSRVVVRTVRDTVYIERKDTMEVSSSKFKGTSGSLNPHPSPLNLIKWIFWILIGLIGLIVTAKVCLRKW